MAKSYKAFTKAELLSILNQKCPGALAILPPPDTFDFVTKTRDGADTVALMVGHYATKKKRTVKDKLYLEEYDTSSQATGGEAPPPRAGEVRLMGTGIVTAPSFSEGQFTYTFYHGKATKNESKLQGRYQGLFYTAEDDERMNNKVKNAKGFHENEVFNKLTASGSVSPFSDTVRALYRFLLVYCGHRTKFEEFKNASGKVRGVSPLVRGLKEIAKRSVIVEHETQDQEALEDWDAGSEDGSQNFVADDKGKKRTLDMEDAEDMAAKKPRTN